MFLNQLYNYLRFFETISWLFYIFFVYMLTSFFPGKRCPWNYCCCLLRCHFYNFWTFKQISLETPSRWDCCILQKNWFPYKIGWEEERRCRQSSICRLKIHYVLLWIFPGFIFQKYDYVDINCTHLYMISELINIQLNIAVSFKSISLSKEIF